MHGDPSFWLGDLSDVPARLRGGVVAIGNFDGVHRGHQAVLGVAREIAAREGVPAIALTFEPHPRTFFRPASPVPRLTEPVMKARIIALAGMDGVVEQRFSRDFADKSADTFVDEVIRRALAACHVVTGFDFHFGRGRRGNPEFLSQAGRRHGFGVTLVNPFCDEGDNTVSSSRIRTCLATGEVAEAAGLLGYRFTVSGEVVHGKKLGRTLGYPTANMLLAEPAVLSHGIYAVRLRRQDGTLHDGVASFGRRPTVEESGASLLETFVFDFGGDLYHQNCQVSFFGYLRGEEKFDGLDALRVQMQRDEDEARALLAGVKPLSDIDRRLCF